MKSKTRPAGFYTNISLSASDISEGTHKSLLGGGEASWNIRGRFQLFFLQSRGLQPGHRFLDAGCGPGRAGEHFIEFLASGNYYGIDFNRSFIEAAKRMIQEKDLLDKHPEFHQVANFALPELFPLFDYCLAFSVLNHCAEDQRELFFSNIPKHLRAGGKIYISHAARLAPRNIEHSRLLLTDTITDQYVDLTDWGWSAGETIFPILEYTKT